MTDLEKFTQGKVLYKNDEGNYVLELWGGSTKHPDSIFHMEDFEMASWVDKTNDEEVRAPIVKKIFIKNLLTYIVRCDIILLFQEGRNKNQKRY